MTLGSPSSLALSPAAFSLASLPMSSPPGPRPALGAVGGEGAVSQAATAPAPAIGPSSGGGAAAAAAFVGLSVLVAGRRCRATARAAEAPGRRRGGAAGGGVAVLERKKPSAAMQQQKKKFEAAPTAASTTSAVPETGSSEPARPLGSTLAAGEGGREVLFAGGLIGGQSAFSSADYNFDPLGLSSKLPALVPWFREAELKHGRIAMLAFVGLIAPEIITIPQLDAIAPKCSAAGIGGELRVVEAHDACLADQMPLLPVSPLALMLMAAGLIEVVTTVQKVTYGWGLTIENAGDYPGRKEIGGFLKQLPKDDTAMVVLKLQELKHARLAMIAFSGAWVQGVLTANGFPWTW